LFIAGSAAAFGRAIRMLPRGGWPGAAGPPQPGLFVGGGHLAGPKRIFFGGDHFWSRLAFFFLDVEDEAEAHSRLFLPAGPR